MAAPKNVLHDRRHWELRAEEARTAGEAMNDPEARRIMAGIARGYARMAERAAKLANGEADPFWAQLLAKVEQTVSRSRRNVTRK